MADNILHSSLKSEVEREKYNIWSPKSEVRSLKIPLAFRTFLFSLYLNDLEFFFCENNVNGLESVSAKCLEQLGFHIKIFIILYADDTVIMSENKGNNKITELRTILQRESQNS